MPYAWWLAAHCSVRVDSARRSRALFTFNGHKSAPRRSPLSNKIGNNSERGDGAPAAGGTLANHPRVLRFVLPAAESLFRRQWRKRN